MESAADTFNNSNASSLAGGYSTYKQGPVVTLVFIVGYTLCFVLCVVGNSFVCAIVAKYHNLHTVTNFFIFNLAAADLLVALFCMPVTLISNIVTAWPFGGVICKLSPFMQGVSIGASIFTLVAIAADRYLAVVHVPQGKISGRQAALSIAAIWLLAAAINIPQAVVLEVAPHDFGDGVTVSACQEEWPSMNHRRAYTIMFFLLLFVVPISVIAYMYVQVANNIWYRPVATSVPRKLADPHEKKKTWVVKMLVVVVVLFFVCWLPLHLITLIGDWSDPYASHAEVVFVYLYPIAHWLAYFNSCMNPVVYGYYNKNFRRLCDSKLGRHGGMDRDKTNGNVNATENKENYQLQVIETGTEQQPTRRTTVSAITMGTMASTPDGTHVHADVAV
ncbi:PREDICTED: neuropeptide FF receptor 2-like [Branchiostoma belcheri]|uniref:Neuropeptide FF receptor 2-like n=1 Tax=Branchiostoma belcheri TaxID=7741 RepID=A0A6P5ANG0_BRABE|nr:PREDICTED: neuropeptide FF receptor 2-like [Branchiostoma belcheri]